MTNPIPDASASTLVPGVSVVLACHSLDRWASILAAITSIQQQTHVMDQLIVSVDHNPALVNQLEQAGLGVTVVSNDGGLRGASANRNHGAKFSKTAITAFLDDDEVAEPEWLETLVGPLADSAVVGTGGRYRAAWHGPEPVWFPDIFGWVVGSHHSAMPTRPSVVRNVWAGNMAVRTEVFAMVGGFRTDFGKVGNYSQPEDTDLCIRMGNVGHGHWVYVPDAVIHHDVPADRATFGFFLRRCYSEGHGKILLGDNLESVSDDALADESDYIRRDIPASLRAELRHGRTGALRFGATVAGIVAAGAGAATAMTQLRLRRFRQRPGRKPTDG